MLMISPDPKPRLRKLRYGWNAGMWLCSDPNKRCDVFSCVGPTPREAYDHWKAARQTARACAERAALPA